jgi:hypothetical protein
LAENDPPGNDLMVMVPTRGRPEQLRRLLDSFAETATCADIAVITDPDDDSYDGFDFGDAARAVLEPRAFLAGKLNKTAEAFADIYRTLMWVADDHVFITPGWDKIMLDCLAEMGGSGWVYPDDKRRSDVPEIWMCSSDVVQALGWFANPALSHFYLDNSIGELGKRSGLIRWCPQAVIEHRHYSVTRDVERDEVYRTTEEMFGTSDLAAFQQWRSDQMGNEVAVLRRQFSPDVAWVMDLVAPLATWVLSRV